MAIDAWFAPVVKPSVTIDRKTVWNAKTHKRFTLDVDLPPGAYEYAIVATRGNLAHKVVCEQALYVAVLPDRTQTVGGELDDGIADAITPVLLAGTLPRGVTAWLVRYDPSADCGAPTDTLTRHQILDSHVENAAYYGYEPYPPVRPSGPTATYGLELGWPDDVRRVVRLSAAYPDKPLRGTPTYVRFDVTPERAQAIRASTPGLLVCL